MYSIFLVTNKHTRQRYIHVLINERDIHRYYSSREHLIELIEKQASKHVIATRRTIWERSYGSYIFKSDIVFRRIAKGFKRPRKAIHMRLNNPNKNGLSDLHKKRIGDSNRGKKKTGRRPWSEERRQYQSEVMKQYKNAKGWYWIVNISTDEEKRTNEGVPVGWRRGRSVAKMYDLRCYAREHKPK